MELKPPVFVVGCPRSGTTLMYDTLLSSGKFAMYLSEANVFDRIAPAFGNLRKLANRRALVDTWLKSDFFQRSGLDAWEVQEKVLDECRSAGDFLRIVMDGIARTQSAERWADNSPYNILYISKIKKAFPNAQFIHMIRDGRDVAMSLAKTGWGRLTLPWDKNHKLAAAGLTWKWLVRTGRKAGQKLEGMNYLEIRYEELVGSRRQTLRTVGSFLNEELDLGHRSVGVLANPNSSFADAADRMFNPVGRWRALAEIDIIRLTSLLATELRELGYPAETARRVDFTQARLHLSYPLYQQLQQIVRKSPLSPFFVDRQRLQPGALDRFDARWEQIRALPLN